ncbi:MAG: hypothetical protein M3P48_11010 [Actinomycetota bacterium]|nr:hypothetical protein [Actinomycetota bacterium]
MDLLRPTNPVPSPAAPLVAALVPVAWQLHAVLAHMEQFDADSRSAGDAPPIPDVLATLLESVLTPLARRRPDDLLTAARILRDASEAIERELFVVTPPRD